ncbi:MAG: DNA primase [Rhodospirillaceae bacterium]|nr:MAG: DNA primase [Rhodospirillaceae bacterium]
MAFPPSFLEDLRQRLSIIDVVGRKVRLIRRGQEASGLCPFHNEKSPSFTVSEDKGFYHCFGCGAHGDVIGFVMNTEGLDFRNAVEKLAAEAGVTVPQDSFESRERAERQATLAGVMELAAKFFEGHLGASTGKAGLDYLRRRGLTPETIKQFRLGFAPDSRTALKAHLEKQDVPEALSVEAGLLIRPEDGPGATYDRFRGRVMFPILDRRGQVIAFGGRILTDEKPKYLNSPETPLFHKGRVLYNLSLAQKPARDKNEIIVAEGYMDVIALAQAGFPQAVAPLGTALTEDQIGLLWRLAPEPLLCFDGDVAGQKAAARAADRVLPILKPGLSLRFAWMPAGEDPDSLIKSQGAAALRRVLDGAEPLVEVVWRMVLADRPLDTPERRSGFRRDLFEAVGRIADKSIQDAYRQEMFARLDGLFARPRGDAPPRRGQAAGSSGSRPARPGGFPSFDSLPNAGMGRYQPRWARPSYLSEMGGGDVREGLRRVQRLPYEKILATLVNHPDLIHRHGEAVILLTFPNADPDGTIGEDGTAGDSASNNEATGNLDKLRAAIIDLAARYPQLDAVALQNHLRDQGFSAGLDSLLARTADYRFTLRSADPVFAEEGLLHVMAVLREPDIRAELAEAAAALSTSMTEENLARFEAAQRLALEAESRRRDIDRDAFGQVVKQ